MRTYVPTQSKRRAHRQAGVAAVEFALIATVFFTLLLGVMEFGRWMFLLNAAGEATRLGARLAVVCGNTGADVTLIKARMASYLAGAITNPATQIEINYATSAGVNNACNTAWNVEAATRCESVTVNLLQGDGGATFNPMIPFVGGPFAIPPFTTTLTRELMQSAGNPVCPT